MESLEGKKESWMLDHALESHPEVMIEVGGASSLFGVQVEKRDKDAMRRILREAIRIMKALGGEKMTVERDEGQKKEVGIKLLNSKREFFLPSIVEISVADRDM